MEKLIYLLGRSRGISATDFMPALLGSIPALRTTGATRIDLLVADLNDPVMEACPARISGPWDGLAGVAQFWLDNVVRRGPAALLRPHPHGDGSRVQ